MRLTGRKSFITGAAKGIGLSVARAFAAEGAAVALADISEEESKKQSLLSLIHISEPTRR